jgi:hypothetical protein
MKSDTKNKEEMRMQTTFEKLGGTYRQVGDYLLPDIEVPESPQIGIWGQRRLQYLRTNKRMLYITMLMGGTLNDHLERVDKSADEMYAQLTLQMKVQEDVTEELKANSQTEWVQRMNNIRNRAAKIVFEELIYA